MANSKFKNLLLAGSLVGLTACGGGGGGGAVGSINNFIENTVSTLDGSQAVVSQHTSTLTEFQTLLAESEGSNWNWLGKSMTGVSDADKSKADQLIIEK